MVEYIKILENEIQWLKLLFYLRIYFPSLDFIHSDFAVVNETANKSDIWSLIEKPASWPPVLKPEISLYSNYIIHNQLNISERILLILSLAIHLKPALFEQIMNNSGIDNTLLNTNSETGLVNGNTFSGLLPTGLTFFYLYAGNNISRKIEAIQLVQKQNSRLFLNGTLYYNTETDIDPIGSNIITMNYEYVNIFLNNELPEVTKEQNDK